METMEKTNSTDTDMKEPVPNTGAAGEPPAGKSVKSHKKEDAALKKLQELQKLQEEKDALQKDLDATKELYQRMLAEYANYKRRTEQEKEQLSAFVKSETFKALLPTLDNLERAASAPPGEEYKAGVDMIIRQLADLLASQGLQPIEPAGQPFDPEQHHAVMREDADGVEADTITEVFQKGYRLGDRVIRPAMVKVAN